MFQPRVTSCAIGCIQLSFRYQTCILTGNLRLEPLRIAISTHRLPTLLRCSACCSSRVRGVDVRWEIRDLVFTEPRRDVETRDQANVEGKPLTQTHRSGRCCRPTAAAPRCLRRRGGVFPLTLGGFLAGANNRNTHGRAGSKNNDRGWCGRRWYLPVRSARLAPSTGPLGQFGMHRREISWSFCVRKSGSCGMGGATRPRNDQEHTNGEAHVGHASVGPCFRPERSPRHTSKRQKKRQRTGKNKIK